MATKQVVYCDFCSAEKGAGNHWFSVFEVPNGLLIAPFGAAPEMICPSGDRPVRFDACGDACISKAFSRWSERILTTKEIAHEATNNS